MNDKPIIPNGDPLKHKEKLEQKKIFQLRLIEEEKLRLEKKSKEK